MDTFSEKISPGKNLLVGFQHVLAMCPGTIAVPLILSGAMGLDAVALATGLGWVAIVLFHSTVFLLELKGIGFRLPTRDEDSQPG